MNDEFKEINEFQSKGNRITVRSISELLGCEISYAKEVLELWKASKVSICEGCE